MAPLVEPCSEGSEAATDVGWSGSATGAGGAGTVMGVGRVGVVAAGRGGAGIGARWSKPSEMRNEPSLFSRAVSRVAGCWSCWVVGLGVGV